jgi:hypothetical protein
VGRIKAATLQPDVDCDLAKRALEAINSIGTKIVEEDIKIIPDKKTTMTYQEEIGVGPGETENEDSVRAAEIRRRFSPETIKIASSFVKDVHLVLLGGESFTYQFNHDDTGVSGLSFSFRSLNSKEDNDLRYECRKEGWDVQPTTQSIDLFYYEQICLSMVEYCGKNLQSMPKEKKRELIGRIPSFIMRTIYDKYNQFISALDLISRGEGEFDAVKKCFAPRS